MSERVRIIVGDSRTALAALPEKSVRCCVTSPPYWGLRDYGVAGQIGLEPTPEAWVADLVAVFREVRRVLSDDGTLWVNCGDAYNAYNGNRGKSHGENKNHPEIMPRLPSGAGLTDPRLKPKDLIGLPWMLAFALRADGWYLRSDIIWHKPNPMPESVTDRPTKSHEYVFLFSKSARYFYDAGAIAEPITTGDNGSRFDSERKLSGHPSIGRKRMPPIGGVKAVVRKSDAVGINGRNAQEENNEAQRRDLTGCAFNNNPRLRETDGTRNARSVWSIPTQGYSGAHFATFPRELAARCIKAGSAVGDLVLDPFLGTGTTIGEAIMLGRRGVGVELNPEYARLAEQRIAETCPLLAYSHEQREMFKEPA